MYNLGEPNKVELGICLFDLLHFKQGRHEFGSGDEKEEVESLCFIEARYQAKVPDERIVLRRDVERRGVYFGSTHPDFLLKVVALFVGQSNQQGRGLVHFFFDKLLVCFLFTQAQELTKSL